MTMLHRVEIENFYSIRDRQTLDLRVPANAPQDSDRLADCWQGSRERAPKVVAVFGANGSGKSNLLRALSFAAWFLESSFSLPAGARLPFEPFNDTASFRRPTRLKFWLSGPENLGSTDQDGSVECPYCYELAISNGDSRDVISEAVFFWPSGTGRKTRLIERFKDGSVKASKLFGLTGYSGALAKVLRQNASVISTLAQLNHPTATAIAVWARGTGSNIWIDRVELEDEDVRRLYMDQPELVTRFNREIGRIDVGVRAVEIRQGREGPEVWFQHDELAVPMPDSRESHGTRQFLKLFPLIEHSLATGAIGIIDELDAAIHSMILPEIVGWFHDPVRNPFNAQLWMTCHNVSLLDELSKDEIVFCEKDRRGRTQTYCLNDVKGVRRDDNYYRKYLGGVFGAVPRIG